MGSCSAGEANTNGIDASEGSLVWVRRRNGSWWPGRIMGLHELSQSCLVSPRSGTPVKLLGRQDASVDWYNLEKSKRVKAFRCGEYDECIEKAKASAANSNKKAVKYARREDAIIHALELESARVGKEPLVFCSRTGKFVNENGVSGGDSLVVSHSADGNEDISDDEDNSNSAPELSQSGISFEEPNQNDSTKMQSMPGRRRRTPNDSEDDGMEGVKRMRGLEDLGVGVVSKRKVPSTSMPEMLQQDSTAHNSSNTGSYLVNGTIFNGVKGQYSSLKRKRSQVTNAQESLKRKNRRRQLTKVLESTAMVSVPVTCDQLPTSSSSLICTVTDGKNSRLDSNDLKKSSLQAINNSNSNEAACENGSSLNIHEQGCEASEISDTVKKEAPGTSHKFIRDVGNEKHTADLSPAPVSCSSGKPQDGVLGQQSFQVCQSDAPSLRNGSHRIEKGSSKWQSKGKRNLRNKSKNRKGVPRKHVNMDNEASISGMPNSDGVSQGAGPKVEASILGGSSASYNLTTQRCKQVAEGEVDEFQDLGKHNMGATEMKVLPDGSLTPQRSLPRRQCRFTLNSKYQTADFPGRDHSSDASLFDVKLEVKSSYRPQRVPLISLASKLNGKAFIGHPLTVEVLDNGHCDTLLSGIRHDPEDRDGYCMVRPNSTTKRRPSKNLSRYRKPSKTKKPSLLNKKIRRLSSLTGHRQSEGQRKPMADKAKGPVISCIPLKVVFSRINEAVSSQARSAHHGALPPSDP